MNKEFAFPDLKLPKWGTNIFLNSIVKELENLIFEENKINLDDLSSFAAYVYPNFNNKDDELKLIAVGVYSLWLWLLDDQLEKGGSNYSNWIEIFEGKRIPNNEILLERLYISYKNEILDNMTDYQNERFLSDVIEWLKSFKYTDIARNGNKMFTNEEYIKARFVDGLVAPTITYFIEYLLGIELNRSQMENKLMKDFLEKSIFHIIIANDVFSYYKDLAKKTENFNYVTVIKDVNKFSVREVMEWIANELDQVMNEVMSLKKQILDSNIGVSERYLNAVIEFICGNLEWSQICKRYQKYVPPPVAK